MDCDRSVAGAAFDGKKLARSRIRKAIAQSRDVMSGDSDPEILLQMFGTKVGDDVAKLVDPENHRDNSIPAVEPQGRQRILHEVHDAPADGLYRRATRQMGRRRRENV